MISQTGFNPNSLLGLYLQEAEFLVKKAGFNIRVLSRDGHQFIATRDYKRDRINVRIVKDKITEAKIG